MDFTPQEINALNFIARNVNALEAKTVLSNLKGVAAEVGKVLLGAETLDVEIINVVQLIRNWAARRDKDEALYNK